MNHEIREMSLGEILDTGFQLIRNHFVLFVGISFSITLPTNMLTASLGNAGDATIDQAVGLIGLGLFMIIVSPISSAAITHAISEVYLSREAGFRDSLVFGLKMLMPLVGTALLMTLLMAVGFLFLILPGIYLWFCYLLLYQVMVIEKRAGWDALKRTRDLSSGHLLRIFGIYLVGLVLTMVFSSVLGIVITGVPVVAVALQSLVQAVFGAFISATMVVVYFDIRCRKEAFDLEHLAGLIRSEASGDQPAMDAG